MTSDPSAVKLDLQITRVFACGEMSVVGPEARKELECVLGVL